MGKMKAKTRAEKRERKKKENMRVSGKKVFSLKKILDEKSSRRKPY